ncbi:ribbon-helix-helix protein, CopG family [Azospirillum sp.]|uniref:ribbon-helix-helix protein, CopG family n=1 Tax=Azospirillum sp. TaxID=34012 RepID=UPI002D7344BC|nr:ribbon-helix-helix protein, CopG family [Azospirillum sp.]HYD70732.1 ribbon-helix-helix protein, CopG family [Azospirillum sp.]
MRKDAALSFRVPIELKEALERAAKDDERSVSFMVERVLRNWLIENGYLPKPET